jgi:hypothetical protein
LSRGPHVQSKERQDENRAGGRSGQRRIRRNQNPDRHSRQAGCQHAGYRQAPADFWPRHCEIRLHFYRRISENLRVLSSDPSSLCE